MTASCLWEDVPKVCKDLINDNLALMNSSQIACVIYKQKQIANEDQIEEAKDSALSFFFMLETIWKLYCLTLARAGVLLRFAV